MDAADNSRGQDATQDAGTGPVLPPTPAELDELLRGRLAAAFPDMDAAGINRAVGIILALVGQDFVTFREIFRAATFVDPVRFTAFKELLARRAAQFGAPLGPLEVRNAMTDFDYMPSAYVAELARPMPHPLAYADGYRPGGAVDGPAHATPRRNIWPSPRDMRREALKGGSIVAIVAIAYAIYDASGSLPAGAGILLVLMVGLFWFFGRRNRGPGV